MKERIKLEKGLVLVRYLAPPVGSPSAIMRASIEAGDAEKGQIVSDPFADENELTRPGQCFVVQCLRPLTLQIDVQSTAPGETPRGSVRVEYLTRSANASKKNRDDAQEVTPQQLQAFRLVGHVAYRGDVTVEGGAWLCGPASPNRIEGFQLVWPDAPQGLSIKYRVSGGPTTDLGQYAGSKGASVPITDVEIWSEGPLARLLSIHIEGLFVHAGIVAKAGQSVKLAGRTPKDELIGLKLVLVADSVKETSKAMPPKARVRIFRD